MPSLSGEQKRLLVDTANRIRVLADAHLGNSRRDWIEQSYAAAIDAIHDGDGNGAIRALVVAVKTAASDAGDEAMVTKLSSELASVLPAK